MNSPEHRGREAGGFRRFLSPLAAVTVMLGAYSLEAGAQENEPVVTQYCSASGIWVYKTTFPDGTYHEATGDDCTPSTPTTVAPTPEPVEESVVEQSTTTIIASQPTTTVLTEQSATTQAPQEISSVDNTSYLKSQDPDGDHLSTWFENYIGTDPNNADTDGDGFMDSSYSEIGVIYPYYDRQDSSLSLLDSMKIKDRNGDGIPDVLDATAAGLNGLSTVARIQN